jgi:hypothetical protein
MSSIRNYSLSGDFSDYLNTEKLRDEINENEGLSKTCFSVISFFDTVSIFFSGNLSNSEITTLDTIIAAHGPTTERASQMSNIALNQNCITANVYTKIGTFIFPGTDYWEKVTNFRVISAMEAGGTSYDVRIIDLSNNNTICSRNFSNVIEANNDMGSIDNLPHDEAIFEIHAKINGNTVVRLNNLNIYHN